MNTAAALKHIFPEINILADVRISNNSIKSWKLSSPQPSEQEMEAAWQEIQAKATQAATLKTALLSAWESNFTPGEQAFLKPLYDAAISKINEGDILAVKTLIETAPSISEDLDTKRNSLLALFSNL